MQSNNSCLLKFDNRSKGQATLEYVLLLFVIVSLVVGPIYSFSTAFQKFAGAYFGDYLSCLIDAGELPSLGGDATNSLCDDEFHPFSLADGKPPKTQPNPSTPNLGGDGTGGSGSSVGNSTPPNLNDSIPPSNRLVSEGSGGVGDSFGSRGRGVPLSHNDTLDSSLGGGHNEPIPLSNADRGSKKSGGGGLDGAGGSENILAGISKKNGSDTDSEAGRLRYVPTPSGDSLSGGLRASTVPASDSDVSGGGRRLAAERAKKKAGQLGDEDVGLTLPNFLKFILITALIIVIIVFVGGQALQISKSQEK